MRRGCVFKSPNKLFELPNRLTQHKSCQVVTPSSTSCCSDQQQYSHVCAAPEVCTKWYCHSEVLICPPRCVSTAPSPGMALTYLSVTAALWSRPCGYCNSWVNLGMGWQKSNSHGWEKMSYCEKLKYPISSVYWKLRQHFSSNCLRHILYLMPEGLSIRAGDLEPWFLGCILSSALLILKWAIHNIDTAHANWTKLGDWYVNK